MPDQDIRWIQRFSNFNKAIAKLIEATDIDILDMSELEKEGLIQRFEYTFELAWKTLQDFVVFTDKSINTEGKPINVFIAAGKIGLINELSWRKMYQSRNKTSHTYDEDTANEIMDNIVEEYVNLLIQLQTRLQVEKFKTENE